MKSYGMQKVVFYITFWTLALFLHTSCEAAGSTKWHAAKQSLAESVSKVLVAHGLCRTLASCSAEQIAFFTQTSKGIEVEIYGLKDESLCAEIARLAAGIIYINKMDEIDIQFFAASKKEAISSSRLFGAKPESSLTLRGTYANN